MLVGIKNLLFLVAGYELALWAFKLFDFAFAGGVVSGVLMFCSVFFLLCVFGARLGILAAKADFEEKIKKYGN